MGLCILHSPSATLTYTSSCLPQITLISAELITSSVLHLPSLPPSQSYSFSIPDFVATGFFLLKTGKVIGLLAGRSSPSNTPHCLNDSVRSKIILSTATIGSARNIPETPAMLPPINTPRMENKALIFTLEPQYVA